MNESKDKYLAQTNSEQEENQQESYKKELASKEKDLTNQNNIQGIPPVSNQFDDRVVVLEEEFTNNNKTLFANEQDHNHHEDHHLENHAHEGEDRSNLDKKELLKELKLLQLEANMALLDPSLRRLRFLHDYLKKIEEQEASKAYRQETGSVEGFTFRPDQITKEFHLIYTSLIQKRDEFLNNQKKERESNLSKKNQMLGEIRDLLNGKETEESRKKVAKIRDEWRKIGQVPKGRSRSLQASYNALMNRYHHSMSIYFELKELDRKRNLDAKENIIKQAIDLCDKEDIDEAIKELHKLHERFKNIGPVPKEFKDGTWEKFKKASDRLYDKRSKLMEEYQSQLDNSLVKKQELASQINKLAQFNSKEIKDWNKKTKEVQELQKQWENAGHVPKDSFKELNRSFWTDLKTFYNNKSKFFHKINEDKSANLEKKQELVEKAKSKMESTSWEETTSFYKSLQSEWTEIGPVPTKFKSIIFEFKEACEAFFDNKRNKSKEKIHKTKGSADSSRTLGREELSIRKKINKLESDIILWKNNMSFFASSKAADKVKTSFNQKIKDVESEIAELKKSLKALQTAVED